MPARPRILFLITDLHLGGSPRMLATLAAGLVPHFDVHVCSLAPLPPEVSAAAPALQPSDFTLQTSPIPAALRAAGVPVHALNLADVSPRAAQAGMAGYLKLLDDLQPDLVYSILIHANALATLGKQFRRGAGGTGGAKTCKLIHAIHTLQPEPRWHWTLEGTIAKTADAVLAPSPAILDRIAECGPFQRGMVIPNGIDVDRFASASPMDGRSRERGILHAGAPVVQTNAPVLYTDAPVNDTDVHADSLRIGYVGRFDPVKRLDVLLHALVRLRAAGVACELDLVGYGEQEKDLGNLATTLQIAPWAHFCGATAEPERWYKSFDLHCLPSPVEGFGLTLVESLAAGRPVVAVKTPATEQIVRPGIDGVLVERLDAASLSSGIQEVVRWLSQGWRAEPSQIWVRERFSAEAMILSHKQILEKILQD